MLPLTCATQSQLDLEKYSLLGTQQQVLLINTTHSLQAIHSFMLHEPFTP